MRLARPRRRGPMLLMTPLVDVMFILLIFFMVTSTFLDLDMIPLVSGAPPPAAESMVPEATGEPMAGPRRLLVRLNADGRTFVAGQAVDLADLTSIVSGHVTASPSASVLVLPSGAATTQALVSLMDALARAGARDVRVLRLEVQ